MLSDEVVRLLLDRADPPHRAELTVLYNSVLTAMNKYRQDPTEQRLRAWRAAEAACEDMARRLAAELGVDVGLGSAPVEEAMDSFSNIRAVRAWLLEQGWRISQSGIYKHRAEGKIAPDLPGGRFSRRRVEAYAAAHLRRADTGKRPQRELEEQQRRKALAETRRAEAQALKLEHELAVLQGRYLPREDFYAELAARALALESGFRAMVQARLGEWIELVGGDATRAPDLSAAVQADLDRLLGEYASLGRFHVLLPNGQAGGEAAPSEAPDPEDD
ncbi:hypothetical protein G3N55_00175 [Dissulfurirhabdus thermomarina]|uniref:Uncharacterized protein n=1 Tax=Dissulfurirhabdus thermomarina TaxID=1765737 RepID=A0A6N9TRR4_DISTH|nr:hypothetical protein [Dissulfurirhabdus thermomarina]NDY41266.1 hypothetical protein [Dissulfurirhabdus thermomarina]